MRTLVIKEGWVWLALVSLTLFGFFNYEAQRPGLAYLVLAAGLAKFFLIFLDFMEMKHAHRAWSVAMLLFILALFGAISLVL